jgi:psiF repeat
VKKTDPKEQADKGAITMLRSIAVMSLIPLLLVATPASALTAAQKMETCKFGADDQKLDGAKRKAFMAKCMSSKDDKRGPQEKK